MKKEKNISKKSNDNYWIDWYFLRKMWHNSHIFVLIFRIVYLTWNPFQNLQEIFIREYFSSLHERSIGRFTRSVNSFEITLKIYSKLRRTTLIYSWLYPRHRLASRESFSSSEQLSMTRSIVPWWKLKIDRTENPGGQTRNQRNKGWWLRGYKGSPKTVHHPSVSQLYI